MSGYSINGLTLHNYGDNLIPLAFVTSRVAWLDMKNQCSTDIVVCKKGSLPSSKPLSSIVSTSSTRLGWTCHSISVNCEPPQLPFTDILTDQIQLWLHKQEVCSEIVR